MFDFVEFRPCCLFSSVCFGVRIVVEGEMSSEDGYAFLVLVSAGEGLGGSLGEINNVRGFVFVD